MLTNFLICILVGLVLGWLAGLGAGGGSLLILWLTLVVQLEPAHARAINLMFFLAAAGTVTVIRWSRHTLQIRNTLPAIIAGICSAALFSWVSNQVDTEVLTPFFGILLLAIGLKELFYRPKKDR